MTAVDRIVYYRYSIIAALGYMYTVPQYTMSRDFSRKLDREGGGISEFPKTEGDQQYLASGKVITTNFGNCTGIVTI